VTQTQAESEEIESGKAISWVVPEQTGLKPGDEVLKGTSIQLLISTGPALREVPSIIGLTLDQAKELLDPLRLDLLETPPSNSNAAAEGLIGAQSPPPGEKVARDSGIAFSISLGPDLVELPNIIGNNYSIVEPRLQEAGFVIGEVTGRKQNRLQKALIVGQEVANGDLVARGSTVDLIFP
jgi:serine/threonine-protein kinase